MEQVTEGLALWPLYWQKKAENKWLARLGGSGQKTMHAKEQGQGMSSTKGASRTLPLTVVSHKPSKEAVLKTAVTQQLQEAAEELENVLFNLYFHVFRPYACLCTMYV